MESLYFLIPLSVVVCILGVGLFFWAVKSGQYDDLDAEGERLLFDDEFDIHRPAKTRPEDTVAEESQDTDDT